MKRHDPTLTGQTLVADFQTVFISRATIEAAQFEASRSESELTRQLAAMSSGAYLNPHAMGNVNQDDLSRASLDAHIKKVQAQQLSAMNADQLQNLVTLDRQRYHGRKVRISVLPAAQQPIDIVWFDQRSGYRTSVARKRVVNGIIEDVLLDRNLLVLKPTTGMRLLNNRLQNYLVYIINPSSLLPMVEVAIL